MSRIDDAMIEAFLEPGVPERNMACFSCPLTWWPHHSGEVCPGCGDRGTEFFISLHPDLKGYSAYSTDLEVHASGTSEDDAIALFFQVVMEGDD